MDEADAYFSPNSIVRQVQSDLPSMVIGGFASLLLQMLHPLAMAGVAQHSRYRQDPLGRMERTAFFIGVTSFGSRSDAESAIATVKAVHARVNGVSPDTAQMIRIYSPGYTPQRCRHSWPELSVTEPWRYMTPIKTIISWR